MVKGVSRQVILVRSADKKLFDQAIFILSEEAQNHQVTDQMLLQEAKNALALRKKRKPRFFAGVWAGLGAGAMGLLWLITALAQML